MADIKFGVEAFQAKEEDVFKYEVPNAQTGDPLGLMCLKGFKQPALDRYREIRNGNGRAKGDNAKAREFLFKKTYVRFEFYPVNGETPTLDLGESKSEVEFFLANCGMLVDAVLIQHLAAVFPDVDEKK